MVIDMRKSYSHEDFFVRRLMQLRNQKGVSARTMSMSIGQHKNYIQNIESQRNFPLMKGFFQICDYLEIAPKDYFDDDNESPANYQKLLELIKRLNDTQQKKVISILEEMVK